MERCDCRVGDPWIQSEPRQVIEELSAGQLVQAQLKLIEAGRRRLDTERLELALEALKQLATMCRRADGDYKELAGRYHLANREGLEWQGLYSKVLTENAELVRGDPDRALYAKQKATYQVLLDEHANLQQLYTSMMRDRTNIHHDLEESQEQVRRLNERLAQEQADPPVRGPGWS